ncbi:MAG: hypothetical protein AAF219_10160 [Myxococcota bacterium]
MKQSELLEGIEKIAQTHTAPYQELEATTALQSWLGALNIQFETDKYGNTFARVRKGMPRRTVALVTHLDSPALRVKSIADANAEMVSEGPIPATGFKSAKVVFPKTKAGSIKATVTGSSSTKDDLVAEAALKIAGKSETPEVDDFATFDFDAFSREDKRLTGGRIGTASTIATIVATLADLAQGSGAVDVFAIFTRARFAENAGAVAVCVDFHLPRDTLMFVVDSQADTTHTLGHGPIVLSGDANGPFDPRATAVLLGAAEGVESKKFRFQRGASPESMLPGVFLAFGLSTGAIAIPTANHRNAGSRSVAAEEVDVGDLNNAITLCADVAVRSSAGGDDLDHRRNHYIMRSSDGRDKLREPIDPVTGYPSGARF